MSNVLNSLNHFYMEKILLTLVVIAGLNSCVKKGYWNTVPKNLTTQPGPKNGQDTYVIYRETDNGVYAGSNNDFNHELLVARWTWYNDDAGEGTARGLIKFPELSTIPSNAIIKSARLYLYGKSTSESTPQGNSFYPGSGNPESNEVWLKRLLANWDERIVTWKTKPATTDVNKATIHASTSQWNYNAEADVTAMVQDMVSEGRNYGFSMQMKIEKIYRCLIFSTSEATDPAKRPKLVVDYELIQY